MKVTTEELERCEVLMTVEVEAQREQDILQKAAKKIARQIKIPGFRPGKAPYNVVVRRFGLEAIQQEAFEDSADKLVQDALNEANVQPFAQIQLESVEWSPLVIKVKVPTSPVVELGEYRDIRLEAEPVEVSEEDVDKALEELQERTATWTPVERPAELGDMVTMSVVEKEGDEVLAQNDSVEYELVHHEHDHEEDEDEDEDEDSDDESSSESSDESSEDEDEDEEGGDEEGEDEDEGEDGEDEDDEDVTASHWHPDLVTPLLGLSAGEEKSFTVDYPADFSNERYAGKAITFEVKVSSVKAKEKDPLDDEFAKTVSDFETLDELRADIEENIRLQREAERNRKLGNEVLDQIVENSTIEWPAAFEDESLEQEVSRLTRDMEAYGISLTNYLQIQNQSQEEFTEQLRGRVVEQLKRTLAMGKVAEQEQLRVSEGEILERAKLIADMSGRGDQFWRNILASEVQQSRIANDILVDKVINWLAAIARGEDPTVEAAEEEEVEATAAEAEAATGETEVESAGAEVAESTEAEVEAGEPEAEVEDEAVEAEVDETAEAEAEEAAEPDEDKSESAGEPAATKA